MTDLSQATYEELSREVEHRLNQGLFDEMGLYSTLQQNHRAVVADVMDQLNALCLEDFDKWNPLRLLVADAVNRHGGCRTMDMRRVYGVNTTFLGRAAEEDHAPPGETQYELDAWKHFY